MKDKLLRIKNKRNDNPKNNKKEHEKRLKSKKNRSKNHGRLSNNVKIVKKTCYILSENHLAIDQRSDIRNIYQSTSPKSVEVTNRQSHQPTKNLYKLVLQNQPHMHLLEIPTHLWTKRRC